jgi:hypothetical protein
MLYRQPTARPTRKVAAGGIAGAITAALMAGVNHQWPGYGEAVGQFASPLIVAAVSFVASYMTRERA